MSLTGALMIPFVIIVWELYYLMPSNRRWGVLAVSNIIFIVTAGGWQSLVYILITALTTYGYAIRLERLQLRRSAEVKACNSRDQKKAIKESYKRQFNLGMVLIISLNIAVWYSFKLVDRMGFKMPLSPQSGSGTWMPIAISFYTLIAIGHLVDVYRKKISPEKNFLRYFTFISFFPQLTEGPFSRYEDLGEALKAKHSFSWKRMEEGIVRILWGYCKKLIIANTLWNSLHIILEDGNSIYAPSVLVCIFLLPLQQYMDFSGCMDIVLGISHVMGIDLRENFRQPEFSKSIAEVWRRWHITLCEWFKDYVFYPVATSKVVNKVQKKVKKRHPRLAGYLPVVIGMACVWTVTGLWHGATWNNLLWGWMNLIILASSFILESTYKQWHKATHVEADSMGWKAFSIVRTIFLFGIMEMMADVSSASQAFRMYRALFSPAAWQSQSGNELLPEMTILQLVTVIVFCIVVVWIDIQKEMGRSIMTTVARLPLAFRALCVLGLYCCLIFFAFSGNGAGFAYASF